jgi:subtilisin family serine protease
MIATLLVLLSGMFGEQVWAQNPVKPAASEMRQVLVLTRLVPPHFQVNSGYGGAYGTTQARRARLHVARRVAHANGLKITDDWPMPLLDMACFVMEVPAGKSVEDTVRQLSQDRDVVFAEPMRTYTAEATSPTYDDPLYRTQPAATVWRLASLHQISTGHGVNIAIIDSGVDSRHPDLAGQVSENLNFVAGQAFKAESHGTGIAGVIAAKAGNKVGIVGVAPGARLLGLRACWQEGLETACDSVSLAKALHFAIERGSQIINMSLAGPRGELLDRLLDVALARKITIVAAYDARLPNGGFPASHRGVIAVADEGQRSLRPDVYAAPGSDVMTTQPGGIWNIVNGSSFAAAHASGLLALMRARAGGGGLALATRPGSRSIDACATLISVGKACDCDCARAELVMRTHR